MRAGTGPDLRAVLSEDDIADPVKAVLDRPVPSDEVGEPGGAGLSLGEAGDRDEILRAAAEERGLSMPPAKRPR